jgi:hypothetical protein
MKNFECGVEILVDYSGPVLRHVSGCCEHSNEKLDCEKDKEFLG